ncbi:MAG: TonB-dependent receptor [Opitutaceae bacterium]|nr:TonB-dependent receptor [Opitutaceae bacterium]
MSYPDVRYPRSFLFRLLPHATSLVFVLVATLFVPALFAQETGTARISGAVTSKSSKNALQGAVVMVPSLNRSVLTDSSGNFSLRDLPAGALDVVVSYTGFADSTQRIVAESGKNVEATFELASADIVQMEAFTVESMKEGQALSITEQRNAMNVKTVVALDEWGVLPTQNIGELASRLPGITYTTDEDDLMINVSIRGQPDSYTRLNVDGMSTTGVSGIGRTATLHSFSASNYEQIEVIAGQTPDKRADSLGGQLNLKTRSPLAMRENRRYNYNFNLRYFPSYSDRNQQLADHPLHPDMSVGYTGVYDVFGGRRNLGIVLNASYQEVVNQIDYDFLQYQFTNDPIAYFHDYDKRSGLNHRKITAFMARADYRLSDSTTVSLRFLYNAGDEPFYDRTRVNPFAPRTIYNATTTPNGAILPDYTANRTEVRPVAGVRFDINTWGFSFASKNPTGTLAFEHDWGRLKVDHAYRWSNTTWWSGAGLNRQAGEYLARVNAPIGFILNNSNLDGQVFTQTAGPSVYAASSYSPIVLTAANTTTVPVPQTSVSFVKRDNYTRTNEVTANVNATYTFATAIPLAVKAGADTVNRRVNTAPNDTRRWYGVVGSTINADLMPISEFELQHGGARLPAYKPSAISGTLSNTALWYEDVNFNATSPYGIGRRIMEEGVDSAYIQFQGKVLNRLNFLGGVRGEWVTTDTFNYFRARTTPIATEPDHYKRAAMDFQKQSTSGDYNKMFPSIHFAYDITDNWKARASWSTSYGRATLQQLVPGATVSDANQTVTVGNPAIKPQEAKNIDIKLEYYFKSTGKLTVGAFQKKITDYIGSSSNSGFTVPSGQDNGYDGLYSGYTIFQPTNLGDAEAEGLEFDYSQRLSFLPGAFKGLTVSGNYTYQRTKGRFAGTTVLNTNQVAGFVPRLFNARVNYVYKKFGFSADMTFKGEYLVVYSTTAGATRWQRDLTRYNVGFTYRVRPEATVFLNFDNLSEAGPEQFFQYDNRTSQRLVAPTSIKLGVTGQF